MKTNIAAVLAIGLATNIAMGGEVGTGIDGPDAANQTDSSDETGILQQLLDLLTTSSDAEE